MSFTIIAHLDMDAFFAAIEERNNPQFRGLPIVVGADPKNGHGRGVVSTANYPARAYGIHSAMPITKAWRLAQIAQRQGRPAAIFISGTYANYGNVSRRIMALIRTAAPLIQIRGIDEAYLDLSFTGSYKKAADLCHKLKKTIYEKERLTASIGIGPNKLIAKIASDHQKPDGLTIVTNKEIEEFLSPLSIRTIPGVGPKTQARLAQLSITTIKDAQQYPRQKLHDLLGTWGDDLYHKVRGRGSTNLSEHHEAQSISEQQTFSNDTRDTHKLIAKLHRSCDNIHQRLKKEGFSTFKTTTVTVRFSDFETHTHAHTRATPSNEQKILRHEALKLFLPYLDTRKNPHHKPIRLIGVRIQKLG